VLGLVHDQWDGSVSNAKQERGELYLYGRSQNQWLLAQTLSLSLGVEGKASLIDVLSTAENPWFSLAGEAPYLEAGKLVDKESQDAFVAGWLELRKRGDFFSWYPGIRLQKSVLGPQSVDPRLTLQLEQEGWDIRLGGGQYTQLPTVEEESLSNVVSHQISSGIQFKGWQDWNFSIDVWGRDIQGRKSGEDGWAAGSEFLASFTPSADLFSWFSIQLARSESQELFLQPFALNLVFSWQLNPNIDVGVRYRYSAGMPYTPPIGARYISQEDRYIPIMDDSASAYLPDYQKIDFHVARKWRLWAHDVVTYAEIWYVPPGANFLYPIYNFNYTQEQMVVGPPLVPLLGIRVEN
jgi:hypothetical protein